MTDIEMTRLCAEAMGVHIISEESYAGLGNQWVNVLVHHDGIGLRAYSPLTYDDQAMALVKRFRGSAHLLRVLEIWFNYYETDDLNRAIVECVAKMQAASSPDTAAIRACL